MCIPAQIVKLFSYDIFGTKYSRMNHVKFVEDSLKKIKGLWFFKGGLPQILLSPFLNTLSFMLYFLLFLNKRFHNRRAYF